MGNTHDTEMARIEADFIGTRWRTTDDYRWGYTKDRGRRRRKRSFHHTYPHPHQHPFCCSSSSAESFPTSSHFSLTSILISILSLILTVSSSPPLILSPYSSFFFPQQYPHQHPPSHPSCLTSSTLYLFLLLRLLPLSSSLLFLSFSSSSYFALLSLLFLIDTFIDISILLLIHLLLPLPLTASFLF